jgi:hypothetical protein
MEELMMLVKENNVMLRYLVQYVNDLKINHQKENDDDFARNVMANLLSNMAMPKL